MHASKPGQRQIELFCAIKEHRETPVAADRHGSDAAGELVSLAVQGNEMVGGRAPIGCAETSVANVGLSYQVPGIQGRTRTKQQVPSSGTDVALAEESASTGERLAVGVC